MAAAVVVVEVVDGVGVPQLSSVRPETRKGCRIPRRTWRAEGK